MHGILAAKLGAFVARTSQNDYLDLEFLGANFPVQVYAVRQQLSLEHRQAFINAFIRENPGPSNTNRVRNIKDCFGIA
jgi:hypothetical protein